MSIRSTKILQQPVAGTTAAYDPAVTHMAAIPRRGQQQPSWSTMNNRPLTYPLHALYREGRALFRRYVLHRGNKVTYLRSLGVRIGDGCDLLNSVKDFGSEPWLIEVGNRVTLTYGVVLITHDGASRLFRETLPGSSHWGNRFGTIRIRDNSFIGVNTIIMPDVEIGPNSIVGAGSVVTKTIPANTVAVGTPARPICTLKEYMERYRHKMVPLTAMTHTELRRELTQQLWGEVR